MLKSLLGWKSSGASRFGAVCGALGILVLMTGCDPCMNNPCNDGNACNGVETCTVDGGQAVCGDGTPVSCADGESCTEPDGTCSAADPCAGNTCDDGDACNGVETCDSATGDCVDGTPVDCDAGQTCDPATGTCSADDLCAGNTCDDGDACNGVETCDAATGDCVDGTAVECDAGQTCNPATGVCEADGGLTGDAAAGETYYAANNCGDCHGPDGAGPPNIMGADAQLIFDNLSGADFHAGGMFTVTEQDAADLAAFLAP